MNFSLWGTTHTSTTLWVFIERSCWDGTPWRGALVLWCWLPNGRGLRLWSVWISRGKRMKKMPWLKADEMVFLRWVGHWSLQYMTCCYLWSLQQNAVDLISHSLTSCSLPRSQSARDTAKYAADWNFLRWDATLGCDVGPASGTDVTLETKTILAGSKARFHSQWSLRMRF